MSSRIRGQEVNISVVVDDAFLTSFGLEADLQGSFAKVRDFTSSPRIDQTEESYLGEDFDDLDQQVHGYDFSFTVDELDSQVLDFLSLIAFKELNKLTPPVITVAATYIYREPNILPRQEVFVECVLKPSERSVGGRKEYVQNSFEGKSKFRLVTVG